jgi:Flp pilus assembly protein TadG
MKPLNDLKRTDNDKGAVIVLVSILLVVILGIAALAIDIGNLAATKGELQKLADGSALAAAGELGSQYKTLTCADIDAARISTIANNIAQMNEADNKPISLQSSDIVLGCWDFDNDDDPFDAIGEEDCNCSERIPNAVSVTARRDSEANTPVVTFFAGILGPETVGLRATAIASLSGLSEATEIPIPVGISKAWFDPDRWAAEGKEFCDQPIKFHPTGDMDGCAGWNVYDSWPANASKLGNLLECLTLPDTDPDYCPPPGASVGDDFVYTGGTVASVFEEMKALYDAKKDPVTGEWKIGIPVYGRDDCSNPQNNVPIVGFTTAIITEVLESPSNTINAKVTCEEFIVGRGGGGNYGTLGTIPGLVQ